MNLFKKSIIIFILALFFIGCSAVQYTPRDNTTYTRTYSPSNGGYNSSDKKSEIMIHYSALSNEAVKSIFSKSKVPDKIIVTEFVNLTSLNNNTRLGYVLSNSIKDSLINTYRASVIEAEVSKYFKLSNNGLKILSRNINNIKTTSFNVEKAVVGTYTYTDSELVIFVKLVNLKTGIIEGSYSKALPMGESTKMMLTNQ